MSHKGRIGSASQFEGSPAYTLQGVAVQCPTHPRVLLHQMEIERGLERGTLRGGGSGKTVPDEIKVIIVEFMDRARALGFEWKEIGQALGIGRNAAVSRHRNWSKP